MKKDSKCSVYHHVLLYPAEWSRGQDTAEKGSGAARDCRFLQRSCQFNRHAKLSSQSSSVHFFRAQDLQEMALNLYGFSHQNSITSCIRNDCSLSLLLLLNQEIIVAIKLKLCFIWCITICEMFLLVTRNRKLNRFPEKLLLYVQSFYLYVLWFKLFFF